jgi:prepilin-type N-terminal cleavage/methylation domain-containing protein
LDGKLVKKGFGPLQAGFTLIEIIVAIMILAIVSVGLLGNFFRSPPKARDAKRRQSLKQIHNALEIYYNDFNEYPEAASDKISCDGTNAIDWGGDFTCSGSIYMKNLPQDPNSGQYTFIYETVNDEQGFRIFTYLENEEDKCFDNSSNCCENGFDGKNCGSGVECNYVLTSPNETPGSLSCT